VAHSVSKVQESFTDLKFKIDMEPPVVTFVDYLANPRLKRGDVYATSQEGVTVVLNITDDQGAIDTQRTLVWNSKNSVLVHEEEGLFHSSALLLQRGPLELGPNVPWVIAYDLAGRETHLQLSDLIWDTEYELLEVSPVDEPVGSRFTLFGPYKDQFADRIIVRGATADEYRTINSEGNYEIPVYVPTSGTHSLDVIAIDALGNNKTEYVQVLVDASFPGVFLKYSGGELNDNDMISVDQPRLKIIISEDVSYNLDRVRVVVDDEPRDISISSCEISEDGKVYTCYLDTGSFPTFNVIDNCSQTETHSIIIYAQDTLENVDPKEINFRINKCAPTLDIVGPIGPTDSKTVSFMVRDDDGDDFDIDLASIEVTLNDFEQGSFSADSCIPAKGGYNCTYEENLDPSITSLKVKVADEGGLTVEHSTEFIFDETYPRIDSIRSDQISAGKVRERIIDLTVDFVDTNVHIVSLGGDVDSSLDHRVKFVSGDTVTFNEIVFSNKPNPVISIYVEDIVGHVTSKNFTFNYDIIPPAIDFKILNLDNSPLQNNATIMSRVKLACECTSTDCDLSTFSYVLDEFGTTFLDFPNGFEQIVGNTAISEVDLARDETWYFECSVSDDIGNMQTSIAQVTYDYSAPIIDVVDTDDMACYVDDKCYSSFDTPLFAVTTTEPATCKIKYGVHTNSDIFADEDARSLDTDQGVDHYIRVSPFDTMPVTVQCNDAFGHSSLRRASLVKQVAPSIEASMVPEIFSEEGQEFAVTVYADMDVECKFDYSNGDLFHAVDYSKQWGQEIIFDGYDQGDFVAFEDGLWGIDVICRNRAKTQSNVVPLSFNMSLNRPPEIKIRLPSNGARVGGEFELIIETFKADDIGTEVTYKKQVFTPPTGNLGYLSSQTELFPTGSVYNATISESILSTNKNNSFDVYFNSNSGTAETGFNVYYDTLNPIVGEVSLIEGSKPLIKHDGVYYTGQGNIRINSEITFDIDDKADDVSEVRVSTGPFDYQDITGSVTPNNLLVNAPVILPQGENTITLFAKDLVGNVGNRSFVVNYDTKPPTATVAYNEKTSFNSLQPVAVRVFADEVADIDIFVDGQWNATYYQVFEEQVFVLTPLYEGTHSIFAQATDIAGNKGQVSNTQAFRFDFNGPRLENPTPGHYAEVGDLNLDFSIDISDGDGVNVSSIVATVNAQDPDVFYDGNTVTFTVNNIAEGEHNVTVTARDLLGNPSTRTWTVVVNRNTPTTPRLSLEGRPNLHTNNPSQPVVLEFSEVVELVDASIELESVMPSETIGTSFTLYPSRFDCGDSCDVLVEAKLTTGTGEVGTYPLSFIFDDVRPRVNDFSIEPNINPTSNRLANFRGIFTETHISRIEINTTPPRILSGDALHGDKFWAEGVRLNPGENELSATAYDIAGNTGLAELNIYYDNTQPEFDGNSIIVSPAAWDGQAWRTSSDSVNISGKYVSHETATVTSTLAFANNWNDNDQFYSVGTHGIVGDGDVDIVLTIADSAYSNTLLVP